MLSDVFCKLFFCIQPLPFAFTSAGCQSIRVKIGKRACTPRAHICREHSRTLAQAQANYSSAMHTNPGAGGDSTGAVSPNEDRSNRVHCKHLFIKLQTILSICLFFLLSLFFLSFFVFDGSKDELWNTCFISEQQRRSTNLKCLGSDCHRLHRQGTKSRSGAAIVACRTIFLSSLSNDDDCHQH